MDLNFTPDEIAFREEARHFFRKEFPQAIREKSEQGKHLTKQETIVAQRALNARGWAVPNWPVEWGGQDWTPVQMYMYQDEMQLAWVPSPLAFNTSMVGPVIAQFGSQAQKERFLPRAANLDDWWCQGFSEPGSGSDLAAVVVPAENLVGQENKGWDYAKFLLGNERTGIARVGYSKAKVKRIKELAALERIGDKPVIEDQKFREKLAAVEVELKALEMTQLRVVADERRQVKGKPNPASSILKLKGSQIQQALTELTLEVVGPFGMPYGADEDGSNEPPVGPDYAAPAAPTYFNYRKVSIYGGSNEIQRNIVAKAILGL
jgi:alkylation response protein AidB-like acyl-CoA dehydrogenase